MCLILNVVGEKVYIVESTARKAVKHLHDGHLSAVA